MIQLAGATRLQRRLRWLSLRLASTQYNDSRDDQDHYHAGSVAVLMMDCCGDHSVAVLIANLAVSMFALTTTFLVKLELLRRSTMAVVLLHTRQES